jgi:hypothetical protein
MRIKVIGATLAVAATFGATAAAPASAYQQEICMYTTEEWGEICTSMIVPLAEQEVACVESMVAEPGTIRCVPRID